LGWEVGKQADTMSLAAAIILIIELLCVLHIHKIISEIIKLYSNVREGLSQFNVYYHYVSPNNFRFSKGRVNSKHI